MLKVTLSVGLIGGLVAVLASGCASEVSEEYRGEPLLRIEGSVRLTTEVVADSVPALVFLPGDDLLVDASRPPYLILDGHVSGEFPAHFEFSVTELPPEGSTFTNEGERLMPFTDEMDASSRGNRASAWLSMVPREHPKTVELFSSEGDGDTTCYDKAVGDSCEHWMTECFGTSSCVEKTFACVVEECPVVSSSGDASLLEGDYPSSEWRKSIGDMDATARVFWDPADATRSYVDVRVCPFVFQETFYLLPDRFDRCTLTNETGDTAAEELRRRYLQSAISAVVIHAEQDIALGWDILPVSAGYNVFRRLVTTPEEFADVVSCRSQAWLTAVTEYNAEHDTSYIPFKVSEGHKGYDTIIARVRELRADCPALWEMVGAGDEVSLTLGPLP